jgi:signal transduction histidine kinase
MVVADDGRGFANGQANHHGFGLGTMGERATAIGGSIGFRSSAQGAQVRAEVPAQPRK